MEYCSVMKKNKEPKHARVWMNLMFLKPDTKDYLLYNSLHEMPSIGKFIVPKSRSGVKSRREWGVTV